MPDNFELHVCWFVCVGVCSIDMLKVLNWTVGTVKVNVNSIDSVLCYSNVQIWYLVVLERSE